MSESRPAVIRLEIPTEFDLTEPPSRGPDGHLTDAWLDWHHARMERLRAAGRRIYPPGPSRWVRDDVPDTAGRYWHVRTIGPDQL